MAPCLPSRLVINTYLATGLHAGLVWGAIATVACVERIILLDQLLGLFFDLTCQLVGCENLLVLLA